MGSHNLMLGIVSVFEAPRPIVRAVRKAPASNQGMIEVMCYYSDVLRKTKIQGGTAWTILGASQMV